MCYSLIFAQQLNSPSNKIQKYERASSFIFVFGQHRQLTIVFVILQENQSLSLARIEVHTHIRTYARCVCNGSRKRLDEPLKFQRISSDLVYCGNPSSKTDSRKKSLLVPGRAPPQYLKFGLCWVFFAPSKKVQQRKYVFIGPINTTALESSPNFEIVTLSPPSTFMYYVFHHISGYLP